MIKYFLISITALFFVACGGGGSTSIDTTIEEIVESVEEVISSEDSSFDLDVSAQAAPDSSKIPTVASTWNIQLAIDPSKTLNTSYDVDMYEIDLFDNDASTIQSLKDDGRIVICYFNGGAYENWRNDASDFPSEVLGNNMADWDGEKWLDISNTALMSIMEARLDLAVSKGCDGVDPDNMDGYTQDSGFTLSYNDQLAYNKYIANESRKRGLSVALKNELEQVDELLDYYDFTVNEQCFAYGECDKLDKFIEVGKAVFNIEYADKYVNNTNSARDNMCSESNSKSYTSLIMDLELIDDYRDSCR